MATEELQDITLTPGCWPNDPLKATVAEGRPVKFRGREGGAASPVAEYLDTDEPAHYRR